MHVGLRKKVTTAKEPEKQGGSNAHWLTREGRNNDVSQDAVMAATAPTITEDRETAPQHTEPESYRARVVDISFPVSKRRIWKIGTVPDNIVIG